jgi:4-carboxymuconolactone decarboxylase
MPKLPKPYQRFREQNASVVAAHDAMGEACAKAGPLNPKTRELVRLAVAVGARLEGAVHSHARRAMDAGASPAEIRHVVTLAAPTLGFPATVAASTWVEDVLPRDRKPRET